MSLIKTDYDEQIRNFLKKNYEPVENAIDAEKDYTLKLTLKEIYKQVTSVLPSKYIYEDDVYEALIELGFKDFNYTIPAKFDDEGEKEIFPEQTEYAYFLNKKTAAI